MQCNTHHAPMLVEDGDAQLTGGSEGFNIDKDVTSPVEDDWTSEKLHRWGWRWQWRISQRMSPQTSPEAFGL